MNKDLLLILAVPAAPERACLSLLQFISVTVLHILNNTFSSLFVFPSYIFHINKLYFLNWKWQTIDKFYVILEIFYSSTPLECSD